MTKGSPRSPNRCPRCGNHVQASQLKWRDGAEWHHGCLVAHIIEQRRKAAGESRS